MSLISFYKNEKKNSDNLYISDIWKFSYDEMERNHKYIQWLFPSNQYSKYNKDAPILTAKDINEFIIDNVLQSNVIKSALMMLDFYGYIHVTNNNEFVVKNTTSPYLLITHNFLRLTRIMNFLNLIRLEYYSMLFMYMICKELKINNKFRHLVTSHGTLKYWFETQPYLIEYIPIYNFDKLKIDTSTALISCSGYKDGQDLVRLKFNIYDIFKKLTNTTKLFIDLAVGNTHPKSDELIQKTEFKNKVKDKNIILNNVFISNLLSVNGQYNIVALVGCNLFSWIFNMDKHESDPDKNNYLIKRFLNLFKKNSYLIYIENNRDIHELQLMRIGTFNQKMNDTPISRKYIRLLELSFNLLPNGIYKRNDLTFGEIWNRFKNE